MAATKPKADTKKAIAKKTGRFRKLTIVLTGAILLSGTSASLAVYLKPELVFPKTATASVSGVACTIVRTIKVRRNGQRWIRQHIKVAATDEASRVATGLRIVGILSKKEEADLYQIVVMDAAAPGDRAAVRGGLKGVDILFAPDPTKFDDFPTAFRVSYREGPANPAGVYNGQSKFLSMEQIKAVMTSISEPLPCVDPEMSVVAQPGEETEPTKTSIDPDVAASDDEVAAEDSIKGAPSTQSEH